MGQLQSRRTQIQPRECRVSPRCLLKSFVGGNHDRSTAGRYQTSTFLSVICPRLGAIREVQARASSGSDPSLGLHSFNMAGQPWSRMLDQTARHGSILKLSKGRIRRMERHRPDSVAEIAVQSRPDNGPITAVFVHQNVYYYHQQIRREVLTVRLQGVFGRLQGHV